MAQAQLFRQNILIGRLRTNLQSASDTIRSQRTELNQLSNLFQAEHKDYTTVFNQVEWLTAELEKAEQLEREKLQAEMRVQALERQVESLKNQEEHSKNKLPFSSRMNSTARSCSKRWQRAALGRLRKWRQSSNSPQ